MDTSIESITLNRMVGTYVRGMLVTLLILSSLISIGIFTAKINITSIVMQNANASHRQTDELSNPSSSTNNTSLSLVQSIPLPNVTGRIDHLGVDKKGERLFVAELGNNSVDIIDLSGGKRISSVTTGENERA